jgi:hypothetical protein
MGLCCREGELSMLTAADDHAYTTGGQDNGLLFVNRRGFQLLTWEDECAGGWMPVHTGPLPQQQARWSSCAPTQGRPGVAPTSPAAAAGHPSTDICCQSI